MVARRGGGAAAAVGGALGFQGELGRIFSQVFWPYVVGFALVQTWTVLCIALPDPVTYGEPFYDLRWLSLATAFALSLGAALWGRLGRLVSGSRPLFVSVGVVASVASLTGPLSALLPPGFSAVAIHVAAVGVGVGFAWLYLAWLPGYLQTAYNLDLKSTGLMAAIPFLFGAAGMLVNGYVTDWLVKGGMAPIKSRKICIIAGMFCSAAFTLVVPQATTSKTAVLLIGMALFCIHFAGTSCWGLIHVAVASRMTASVGSIQNFASFICASFAPIINGFIVDTTHSFRLALIICGCVTAAGALAYIFLVRQPINDPRKD